MTPKQGGGRGAVSMRSLTDVLLLAGHGLVIETHHICEAPKLDWVDPVSIRGAGVVC